MNHDLDKFIDTHLFTELKGIITRGIIGFEKESLRVKNTRISKSQHPRSLGSALCNQYITTDFSEAQLEIVTPPLADKEKAFKLLEDIHHFISCNLDDEILWPFSMPVDIIEEEIPIAYYGSSNLGVLKQTYRNGLSHRYGRIMQAISGLHYNYSVPEDLWGSLSFHKMEKDSKKARSAAYFNMLRNIYRINWLILYLFGASPILMKSFLAEDTKIFKKLDKKTLYLPYATSLRMSNYGYQNSNRKKLEVSVNSIDEYISDLRNAANAAHPEFLKIQDTNTKLQAQINKNVLQIDDEYYAVARAKSKIVSDEQTTSKLNKGGVDFIELRSLDLNPFSRVGIDRETRDFIEVLLTDCFIRKGEYFTDDEIKTINHNDGLVATKGRYPKLELLKDGEPISLKDWGNQIIDRLLPIANLLDDDKDLYTHAVIQMKNKINDPSQTLSGRLLDKISNLGTSFIEFGTETGEANKKHYLNLQESQNPNWDLLKKEAVNSHNEQKKLEQDDGESFQVYLKNYLNY